MQKLIEFIAKSIVQKPDEVRVEKKETDDLTEFQLKVDPDDLKFVIGRQGRTIKAIRNILRIKAINEKKRVHLNLVES